MNLDNTQGSTGIRVSVQKVSMERYAGFGSWRAFRAPKTKPQLLSQLGFRNLILTMTYSHMGKPHTTIGDASFHC
ncbi:hypothetical protein, partial [Pseudomonas carnis]